jgi:hypothetical protein
MENIPFYVYVTFVSTVLTTIYFFYKATKKSKGFIILIFIWLLLQSIISILGFYTITNTMPPRFQLFLLPAVLFIIVQFSTKRGQALIDTLDIKFLTIIHVVRIPVEIVLYWLLIHKAVPELMTFEGRNFDIISGITAPFIYYFGFIKNKIDKSAIIAWNIICLGLLLNVVVNGLLSVPSPIQKFGFEQPNIAVLHFPFIFLPACIVPIILFSHLSSIKKLAFNKSNCNKYLNK